MPSDNLSNTITGFNERTADYFKNPTVSLNIPGAIGSVVGGPVVGGAMGYIADQLFPASTAARVGLKDGELIVDTPLFDALEKQVTGKADGGPIVPQGGIGNFYGR